MASGVVVTGSKFTVGVNDASRKFVTGVNDAGSAPCFADIFANFYINLFGSKSTSGGRGEDGS